MTKTIPFVIDHLDPLGQGVSKRVSPIKGNSDKKQSTITFISKTLPGEHGVASVIKSSKGVEFAELSRLDKISPQRIEPECPHFAQCSGCDYLHVAYNDEITFKKNALLFLLRNFTVNGNTINEADIELISAAQRFNYRNRVQLHYRHKYLGLISAYADQVLEVPHCRLASPALKNAIDQLYADKNWVTEHQGRGHVEIYERDGSVLMQWNQPYAHGGFSQVNPQMNNVLRKWLSDYFAKISFTQLLDLFSGSGNLSDDMVYNKDIQRQMVDMSPWHGENLPDPSANASYLQLDLFDEGALASFMRRSRFKQPELLLLDPPRKGFPMLIQWTDQFKPQYVVYVSCNAATLARDLYPLLNEQKKTGYCIQRIVLIDMFPGTHHFETIVVLHKK